jgi:putative restriction endonuclease
MSRIEEELELRKRMWKQLLEAGGPRGVEPKLLRQLGIYGGAQGIWVDKDRTRKLTHDAKGITVGLLHTGMHYDDDLTESCVLYHYPNTGRPPGRDAAEVDSTKACRALGLPVFVIHKSGKLRDVFFGWVEAWDDDSEEFLVAFSDEPPPPPADSEDDFVLTVEGRTRKKTERLARANQNRFKFQVRARYGATCAVCPVAVPEILEAAHIFEIRHRGSDDARNGLVLCPTHHRAFDRGLFAIDPETTALVYKPGGPTRDDLRITRDDLRHLPRQPHSDALKARHAKW